MKSLLCFEGGKLYWIMFSLNEIECIEILHRSMFMTFLGPPLIIRTLFFRKIFVGKDRKTYFEIWFKNSWEMNELRWMLESIVILKSFHVDIEVWKLEKIEKNCTFRFFSPIIVIISLSLSCAFPRVLFWTATFNHCFQSSTSIRCSGSRSF